MKVIDLTHTIREGMPVYPGTDPPRLIPANSYEKNGFKETLLQMCSHTGNPGGCVVRIDGSVFEGMVFLFAAGRYESDDEWEKNGISLERYIDIPFFFLKNV